MRHGNCYVCDHHTHLSNRGRCADCERDRARENERENDKLREQLAKSEQYIYDLTNADTGEVPTLEAQLSAAERMLSLFVNVADHWLLATANDRAKYAEARQRTVLAFNQTDEEMKVKKHDNNRRASA